MGGAVEPTHLRYSHSQRRGNRHTKKITGRENPIIWLSERLPPPPPHTQCPILGPLLCKNSLKQVQQGEAIWVLEMSLEGTDEQVIEQRVLPWRACVEFLLSWRLSALLFIFLSFLLAFVKYVMLSKIYQVHSSSKTKSNGGSCLTENVVFFSFLFFLDTSLHQPWGLNSLTD